MMAVVGAAATAGAQPQPELVELPPAPPAPKPVAGKPGAKAPKPKPAKPLTTAELEDLRGKLLGEDLAAATQAARTPGGFGRAQRQRTAG